MKLTDSSNTHYSTVTVPRSAGCLSNGVIRTFAVNFQQKGKRKRKGKEKRQRKKKLELQVFLFLFLFPFEEEWIYVASSPAHSTKAFVAVFHIVVIKKGEHVDTTL